MLYADSLRLCPRAESPNSLIERGHYDQARTVLRRTRGIQDVELEFEDIYQASQAVRRDLAPLLSASRRPRAQCAWHCTPCLDHCVYAAPCGRLVAATMPKRSSLVVLRSNCDLEPLPLTHMIVRKQASLVKNPWRTLLERRFRPQLVITILMPFFQQFTGINAVRAVGLQAPAAAAHGFICRGIASGCCGSLMAL